MSMSGLPIIHPVWVVRSIKAKQLLPMYCFSDEPQISSLRQLSAEQRDLAELLKARTQYTSDQLYEVLHECVGQFILLFSKLILTSIAPT